MNEEIWKPVAGYEGLYEISNFGNIKSIGGKKGSTKLDKIMKPKIRSGYCIVNLYNNKNRKTVLVHRVVAQHFIKNKLNKGQVNHIDNNRSNNNVSNLEWCSQKENIAHAVKQARMANGTKHGRSKLKESDVLEIRSLIESGDTFVSIAKKFCVSDVAIHLIKKGVNWAYLK